MDINISKLTAEIIAGRRLQRGEDLTFLVTAPLAELLAGAGQLQQHFCGERIDLCTIINGRSGRCSENCKYCAQAACHHTEAQEYSFLDKAEILANAQANQKAGVHRFAIVTSGRALGGQEFDQAIAAYQEMKASLQLKLCASHGLLTLSQLQRLRAAGVENYHHNIETSRRFFPQICTSHTYDDRIRTIKLAQQAGLSVCSGGIIGMGETWTDRLDMAVSLAELNIRSIPINALLAIKGTDMEGKPPLPSTEIMRTIAIFRFINPEANIRLAAGRKLLGDNGAEAFMHGASAAITGNMLTTTGTTIVQDIEMLQKLQLAV